METVDETGPRVTGTHRVCQAVLVALALGAVLPALFSWRLIERYASLPKRPVRELSYGPCCAGSPPEGLTAISSAPDGSLVALDHIRRVVLRLSGHGFSRATVLATIEAEPGQHLLDLEVGSTGEIYVLDAMDGSVRIFSPSGAAIDRVRPGHNGARGLSIGSRGEIFVADPGSGGVAKLHPSGEPDVAWGDPRFPGMVSVRDAFGVASIGTDLFVSSAHPPSLFRIDRAGRVVDAWTLRSNPGRLRKSPSGHLYLNDGSTGRVWVFDGNGRLLHRLASESGNEELGIQIQDLAFTASGDLIVAEPRQIKILRFV